MWRGTFRHDLSVSLAFARMFLGSVDFFVAKDGDTLDGESSFSRQRRQVIEPELASNWHVYTWGMFFTI